MTSETAQDESLAAKGKQLSIKRSLLLLAIFVGSQIVFAIGFHLSINALGDAYPALKNLDREIIALTSTISAMLVALLWISIDLGRFGRGFGAQIGFRAAGEIRRHPLFLFLFAFLVVRLLVWAYRIILLPYLGIDNPVGGGTQMFAYFQANPSIVGFAAFSAMAFVIGPVVEELVFRGYLQSALSRRIAPLFAIILTSLVFMLLHGPTILWPAYFLHSVLFGWIYAHTKSIKMAMLFHMLNNLYYLVVAMAGLSWLT